MERVMAELANYFSKKEEFEIHLILYGINREVFYNIQDSVIIHIPPFKFNNKVRVVSSLRTIFFLRRIITKLSPYSILSFGEYWNSFVLLSLIFTRFIIFISDRCSPEKRYSLLHTILRKVLYPGAAGIIAQTETAFNIYTSQGLNNNIRVIGNPIRLIPNSDTKKEKIILSVGRLIKSKNHEKLVNLFLTINFPGWKLVIVGEDHLKQKIRERIEKIIKENNAIDRILLVGKRADVDLFYLKSMIFATASSSEGFPNVIGEAMSAGLPVIAFDCVAGPSELIIDNYNGFLIPLNDDTQFANKLRILMEDQELRIKMSEKSFESVKKFSVEIIGEEYFSLLTKIN